MQVSGPITSVYRWEGNVEMSSEHLLTAKTTATAYDRVVETILKLHPYDLPEVLAVPIIAGHADYLKWLEAEVDS